MNWAGNPHDKTMVTGPNGPRLTPRTSFALFVESVRERSLPWTLVECEAVAKLQQQLIELRVADARQRYTVLGRPRSRDELLDGLVERFERREQAERDRIQQVVSLVTHDGCQVNELVGYFGEVREEPCGHCSFCLTGAAQQLPERLG